VFSQSATGAIYSNLDEGLIAAQKEPAREPHSAAIPKEIVPEQATRAKGHISSDGRDKPDGLTSYRKPWVDDCSDGEDHASHDTIPAKADQPIIVELPGEPDHTQDFKENEKNYATGSESQAQPLRSGSDKFDKIPAFDSSSEFADDEIAGPASPDIVASSDNLFQKLNDTNKRRKPAGRLSGRQTNNDARSGRMRASPRHTRAKSPSVASGDTHTPPGIPPGYSTGHWDQTQLPILLLGQVFDAESLGGWIYHQTKLYHGGESTTARKAEKLWKLLDRFAQSEERAINSYTRIQKAGDLELVEDFMKSSDRLRERLEALLRACEPPWEAIDEEARAEVVWKSGYEVIDYMFGPHRKLPQTDQLLASLQTWLRRFDANCESIIRSANRKTVRRKYRWYTENA
jgi:hypothetical protein